MSIEDVLFSCSLAGILLGWVFYVIFGQVTVRRLRRNPQTKDALGLEFASGWDIFNAAEALCLPRSWMKKLESSPLSALYAKSERLRAHTTRFDRALAAVFFWLFSISGFSMILLMILNLTGVFD